MQIGGRGKCEGGRRGSRRVEKRSSKLTCTVYETSWRYLDWTASLKMNDQQAPRRLTWGVQAWALGQRLDGPRQALRRIRQASSPPSRHQKLVLLNFSPVVDMLRGPCAPP